jgi:hypothetical protein
MNKLEKLTPEQKAMIPVVRKEWEDLFYKSKGIIDKPLFEKQIAWLYKKYLNRNNPYIWYCESPLMCQLIINILNLNLRDNLWANLRDNLRANLSYNLTSYWCNISDYGWVAVYDFIQKTNYFKEYDFVDFDNYKLLLNSKMYDFIVFPSVVFVSSCPYEVHQEINKRLHNIDGPAIRFKDGYDVYAIHGRILPSWIWEKKNTITKEMFISEKNSEIRAAMYSILGEKRMMEILDAKEIDKQVIQHLNDEVEIVKLFKTNEIFPETGNNPLAWVKFTCPSTGTDYLISCEPGFTNAKEAVASLSIFKKEEYSFNFRT